MDEVRDDYEVGYGKPPRKTQFATGRSGNPRGRPKGSKNLATLVLKESRQPVRINGPSGVRTVSKLQAAIMQLGNKSAQGDLRASREFLSLVQRSEESSAAATSPVNLPEADKLTMQNLLRRMNMLAPVSKPEEE
jgi:hypothetical protein